MKHIGNEVVCADSAPEPPRSPLALTESTSAASLTDDYDHASSTGLSSETSSEDEGVARHWPFSSILSEPTVGDTDPGKAAPEYDEVPVPPSHFDIFEHYGLLGVPPGTWRRSKYDEPQHDHGDMQDSVQKGRMILDHYGVFGVGCGSWARTEDSYM